MLRIFQPYLTEDLKRLGSRNDGGYVCSLRAVHETKTLISLGVGDNWEFESNFLSMNSNSCFAILVDHSINFRFWSWSILRKISNRNYSFKYKIKGLLLPIQFAFFKRKGNVEFIPRKVGSTSENGISLAEIVEKFNSNSIYLKIDIEGSEYRIMDEIISLTEKLNGLTMEFHDFDLHHDVVSKFVNELAIRNFYPVWVNANNCAEISRRKLPEVIEFTFSPTRYINGIAPKDSRDFWNANNPNRDVITLQFDI